MRGCGANGQLNESAFGKPLPTIGLYVACASLCCAAAMAVDACHSIRSRRLWFPSKYFTLNAATLTVLAVATKLPVDLNTSMPRRIDQLSKLSSTVLICTAMGNLMPSLGVTDNAASNIVALGILVITVTANVAIQMGTGVIYVCLLEHAITIFSMLVLLILLISSALPVSTTKWRLERQYDSKYDRLADEGDGDSEDKYDERRLKERVKKFWLMAHTSSPQYVLGRSATCTASGAFCLLSTLLLAEASVRSFLSGRSRFCTGTSQYRWSIILVYVSQVIAVVVGTVAPACRWFTAVSFRRPVEGSRDWRDEFKVEDYWIEKLVGWKEDPLRCQFGNRRCRKIANSTKNLILGLLIKMQMGIVLASKVVRLLSILPVVWLKHGTRLFRKLETIPSSVTGASNLEDFVLHLEGEEGLVKLMTRNERKDTHTWIEKGKKKRPIHLASLIEKRIPPTPGAQVFISLGRFDSNEVASLVPEGQESPHCWALPVVTLACIATALPGVEQSSLKPLLSGVGEGLRYVRQIEKNLEAKGLLNQRKAADIVWSSLSLYKCWFELDLRHIVPEPQRGSKDVIEKLRATAEAIVQKFLNEEDGLDKKRTLQWPPKVLAANCMYRLTSTILRHCYQNPNGEAHLFCCWLEKPISDLLGACLTNLPRAIHMECFCNAIEVREESVRDAALLLGEAEDIMLLLAEEKAASSYAEEKVYVEDWQEKIVSSSEWRFDAIMCPTLDSTSSNTLSGSFTSIPSTISTSTDDESLRSGDLAQQQRLPSDMV